MDGKDQKRKAHEISVSPRFASEKINELTTALAENDATLRQEITMLRTKTDHLTDQVAEKTAENKRLQAELDFLYPDAVIDRVRRKLWHHGDLSLLRKAIDPRTRVLRNVKGRLDCSLYLCDTPTKKAGKTARSGKTSELKQETEETAPPSPTSTDPNARTYKENGMNDEKQEDDTAIVHETEETAPLSPTPTDPNARTSNENGMNDENEQEDTAIVHEDKEAFPSLATMDSITSLVCTRNVLIQSMQSEWNQ